MALPGAKVGMVPPPPTLSENVLAWILLAVVAAGLTPVKLRVSEYSLCTPSLP